MERELDDRFAPALIVGLELRQACVVGVRLLYRVNVRPLEMADQLSVDRLLVRHLDDDAGNLRQLEFCRRPPSALAVDDLVDRGVALRKRDDANGDRRLDALRADALLELFLLGIVKVLSWIGARWHDEPEREICDFRAFHNNLLI